MRLKTTVELTTKPTKERQRISSTFAITRRVAQKTLGCFFNFVHFVGSVVSSTAVIRIIRDNCLPKLNWAGYALLSAASFAAMAACIRVLSASLPEGEVVFFRNFLALLLLLPLAWRRKVSLATDHFGLHLLRATAGLAAMSLYFYALYHLPLADAILLNYTSPLFIALFATWWLQERWTQTRMLATLVGLVGVALLFHPSSAIASAAGIAGLASGAFAGLALTSVKKLSGSDESLRIVLWFALLGSLISAAALPFGAVMPPLADWGWLLGMGFFGNVGQLALTRAYQLAPANKVSPLGYSGLIFAGIIGYLFWGETPDLLKMVGAAIIISACLLVLRERTEPMPEPPGSVPEFASDKQ